MMTAEGHDEPIVVDVALAGRGYAMHIGRRLIAELGTLLLARCPHARAAIVTDETVAHYHLAAGQEALARAGVEVLPPIVVAAGEGSKSWAGLQEVCEALIAARIERGDVVVALGGGVVGDLAGFAAAVVRRGITVVQVPTTLLAQVDAAVGGKTGINSRHGKNLIGAFHQPSLVVADTALLDTLSARSFRAGYAEIVKYGLINDPGFFAWLESNWREVLSGGPAREQAIATSCRTKAAFVARDERETGERALLNLGHTFAHALEAATGFSDRLLHGEAVAIGLSLAFGLSARLGLVASSEVERVNRHLAAVGLPADVAAVSGLPGPETLVGLMAQDKKVRRGELTFILVRGIGASFVARAIDPAIVNAFLADQYGRTRT
jgi:3-dehydroquinate synthase